MNALWSLQRAALVQIISHELRTPLTVLRGSIETLVERGTLVEPGGRELVLAMERAVLRLQDMVAVSLAAADDLEGDVACQEDAFEPSVQADATERRTHPGPGMGLYTARRLARRWGRDVVLLAREQAAGSLAEVRLPQQRGALSN